MSAVAIIGRVEARGLARRHWPAIVLVAGIAVIIAGAIIAATRSGMAQADTFRSWTAAVYLIGGLALAMGLGASAVNRDADGGWVGLQVCTGTPRVQVALGRVAGRIAVLISCFIAWAVGAIIVGAIMGLGFDAALLATAFAMLVNMILVTAVAAFASVALGPIASGTVGLLIFIFAQASVNLAAATDAGVIGTAWSPLIQVIYAVFPRAIVSPMLSAMQAQGTAGVAAPQFEINGNIVTIPAASLPTVVWTLLWCALLVAGTAGAMRRRALS